MPDKKEEKSLDLVDQTESIPADLESKPESKEVKGSRPSLVTTRMEAIKLSTIASGGCRENYNEAVKTPDVMVETVTMTPKIPDTGKPKEIKEAEPPLVKQPNNSNEEILETEEAPVQSFNFTPSTTKAKPIDCFNFTGGQPVITNIGSKDPMVKKMVYNQYREMLRSYRNTSSP